MSEEAPPTAKVHWLRGMILGSAGILLALALAWFAGTVAIPAWSICRDMERCHADCSDRTTTVRQKLETLGGPKQALRRLSLYLRLPERLAPHRQQAVSLLGGCGDRALPKLLELLGHPDQNVRKMAAAGLAEIKDARAVEPLIAALNDEYCFVRYWSAVGLGHLGDARAIEPLIGRLKDADGAVRTMAAWALVRVGDHRASQPLITALRDDHQDVLMRCYAAEALGRLGDARAVDPLIEALKDKADVLRCYAAGALGVLGDARAVAPLKAMLHDQDSTIKAAARSALQQIEQATKERRRKESP